MGLRVNYKTLFSFANRCTSKFVHFVPAFIFGCITHLLAKLQQISLRTKLTESTAWSCLSFSTGLSWRIRRFVAVRSVFMTRHLAEHWAPSPSHNWSTNKAVHLASSPDSDIEQAELSLSISQQILLSVLCLSFLPNLGHGPGN